MIKQKVISHLKDKKKQNFFIYGIGQAFSLISPLLVVPHIMDVCGEEGLGKVGYGFALALFLILVVDYGFDIKGTKEVSENREDKSRLSKIFNLAIFSKFYLFSIVAVVALSTIYSVSDERQLFVFSLLIVLAQVFSPAWFLQGLENFKTVSILTILSKVLYLILIFAFVAEEQDYILVNLLLGLSSLIFNIVGMLLIKARYKIRILPPAFKEVLEILKADFSFCMSQLLVSVRQQAPLVLTGYLLGYYTAGQYKLIEQIIMPFRTLMQAFLRYFYPTTCYKMLEDKKSGFSFWKKYSLYNFLIVLLGVLFIFLFPDEILSYFNASSETISNISSVLKVAVCIPLLMAVSLPLEQLMFVMNKNRAYINITVVATAISIILMVIMLLSIGILGIVTSLIISEVVLIILYFINSYLLLVPKSK